MTKIKAKRLVDRFSYNAKEIELGMNFQDINHAKECALICVDEMIKENIKRGQPTIDLQELKQEIDKS